MEERITNRDWTKAEIQDDKKSVSWGYRHIRLKKLWELENGLEDGTIIKLPCKVGDKFYLIYKYPPEIIEKEVCGFTIEDNEITLIDGNDNRYNQKLAHYCDEDLVYSRAEAEKKFAELKGEE